uniref:Uncharacterized protein n=1 Tax=Arundo donax TaxID=35708 RepID=A0A0A8Z549_ARUDO
MIILWVLESWAVKAQLVSYPFLNQTFSSVCDQAIQSH